MPTDEQLRRKAEEMAHDAGAGTWFRKSDGLEVVVDVTFYPKLQRWVTINGDRRRISPTELGLHFKRLGL